MRVVLANRQRRVRVNLPGLRRFADAIAPKCLACRGPGEAALAELEEVDIVLVSDKRSAEVHERFMGVPGATDVITFQHGEIVICPEVAQRQARRHRQTLDRELRRYIVHGLLHLNGHEDKQPAKARAMWRAQEALLGKNEG